MKSAKWNLIWLDVKSWAITTALMFSPILIGAVIEYVKGYDLGDFGVVLLLALGALLKLAQKWSQSNTYK